MHNWILCGGKLNQPSQEYEPGLLFFFFNFLPDRSMSVSTPQPAPYAHIYTKRIHQRPALITRQKINTSPQMVSFTQSFLCMCTTVWVFVRRSPAGQGSLHIFFFSIQGQLRTRARRQECNFYFPMFYADICAALWHGWVEAPPHYSRATAG